MKTARLIIAACFVIMMAATGAQAIPQLQLGIPGGTYDTTTETTISAGKTFDLYAYLYENGTVNGKSATLDSDYFISIAIWPAAANDSTNYGTFSFAGNTYDAQLLPGGDMTYGIPPIAIAGDVTKQGQDTLAPHDVYPTLFMEYGFNFESGKQTAAFNTQDGSAGSGSMYYEAFHVDTTGLADGYYLHFDLYNTEVYEKCAGPNCVDHYAVNAFAPFSHDAQSNGHQVPEPSSIMLIGMGLAGLGIYGRRKKS